MEVVKVLLLIIYNSHLADKVLFLLPLPYSDWQMARDPSLWGDDCGEFLPDRWIDEKGSIKQYGPFKFHAFNVRPSTCYR
jgi:hypothetical protein